MFFADRNFLGKRDPARGIRPRVIVPLAGSFEDPGDEIAKMVGGFPSQTAFHFLQYESLQVDGFDIAKPAARQKQATGELLEFDGSVFAWKV